MYIILCISILICGYGIFAKKKFSRYNGILTCLSKIVTKSSSNYLIFLSFSIYYPPLVKEITNEIIKYDLEYTFNWCSIHFWPKYPCDLSLFYVLLLQSEVALLFWLARCIIRRPSQRSSFFELTCCLFDAHSQSLLFTILVNLLF